MNRTIRYFNDRDGGKVAYAVFGEGPMLVCPCWWVSHVEKDWESPVFSRFFSTLGRSFRVLLYDRPGVGLSDRDGSPRTLDSEVALLEGLVDEVADGQPISFLAFSCGVPIAVRYAAAHPERVTKLCCYGGFLDGQDIATADVQKLMLDMVRTHWGMGSRALADIFIPDQTRAEFDQLSKLQRYSAGAEKAAELLELTYAMDATDAIDELSTDMIMIHRSGDRAIPCAAGRRLAAAVPGTPSVVLQGNAHPPWFGSTDVLEAVMTFLLNRPIGAGAADNAVDFTGECRLDAKNRQLISPDGATPLTPLEYGVVQYLVDSADQVVTRDELLEHVWLSPVAGSNKVDAVIRTLRRKFGRYSAAIETVRGHGFRYRPQ